MTYEKDREILKEGIDKKMIDEEYGNHRLEGIDIILNLEKLKDA